MSLSELMSGFDLAVYAEVGLMIFFVIFLIVSVRAIRMAGSTIEHASWLPLNEGAPPSDELPAAPKPATIRATPARTNTHHRQPDAEAPKGAL